MEDVLYHTFYEVEKVHWWCVSRREIVYAVTQQLLPEGSRLLDIGCGTGFFIEKAQEQYDVWGLDASPLAVSMCRDRGLKNVFEGSALDLSAVSGEKFDAILLLDVLEHLDDEALALAQIRELLKPGGHLIITVPAFKFLWSKHDDISQHRRRYVKGQLEGVLTGAGFGLSKLSYFNSYLFPLAFARRVGRKLTGTDDGVEFNIPPLPLNEFLRKTFAAETQPLLKTDTRGAFPIGLSLLAVGQAPD